MKMKIAIVCYPTFGGGATRREQGDSQQEERDRDWGSGRGGDHGRAVGSMPGKQGASPREERGQEGVQWPRLHRRLPHGVTLVVRGRFSQLEMVWRLVLQSPCGVSCNGSADASRLSSRAHRGALRGARKGYPSGVPT